MLEAYITQIPELGMALRHHEQGRLEAARLAYLSLIDRHPAILSICLHQLGIIALAKGEFARAVPLFSQAISLDNKLISAHENLCAALFQLGDRPLWLSACVNLGCCLLLSRQRDNAVKVFQEVIRHDPLNYPAHINLGTACAWLDQLDLALYHLLTGVILFGRVISDVRVLFEKLGQHIPLPVIALPEGAPSGNLEKIEEALTTLGKVLSNLSYPDAAIMCHRAAVRRAPYFALGYWNLSLALLAQRQFVEGWKHYEWRWQWDGLPEPHRQLAFPTWRGESLAGKRILVWGEQGSGDIIQFSPLLYKIIEQAETVVFEVPVQLVRLMQLSFPMIQVISRPDHPHTLTIQDTFDYVVPLLSLPCLLQLDTPDLPLAQNYLTAPKEVPDWLSESVGGVKVGWVWAGNPLHSEDVRRSLSFKQIEPLLENAGIESYAFQVGQHALSTLGMASPWIKDISPDLKDFADTAAGLMKMDVVICVDTGVAHLAAALGRPVWLLLPKVSDWRWGESEAYTEWYPTVRIFRQSVRNEWSDVIQRVQKALSAYVNKNEDSYAVL